MYDYPRNTANHRFKYAPALAFKTASQNLKEKKQEKTFPFSKLKAKQTSPSRNLADHHM